MRISQLFGNCNYSLPQSNLLSLYIVYFIYTSIFSVYSQWLNYQSYMEEARDIYKEWCVSLICKVQGSEETWVKFLFCFWSRCIMKCLPPFTFQSSEPDSHAAERVGRGDGSEDSGCRTQDPERSEFLGQRGYSSKASWGHGCSTLRSPRGASQKGCQQQCFSGKAKGEAEIMST